MIQHCCNSRQSWFTDCEITKLTKDYFVSSPCLLSFRLHLSFEGYDVQEKRLLLDYRNCSPFKINCCQLVKFFPYQVAHGSCVCFFSEFNNLHSTVAVKLVPTVTPWDWSWNFPQPYKSSPCFGTINWSRTRPRWSGFRHTANLREATRISHFTLWRTMGALIFLAWLVLNRLLFNIILLAF